MLTETEAPDAIADLAEELGAPCWHDLCEKDDRTSPEDYPDHALITRGELIEYIKVALDMAQDPKVAALHMLAVKVERERCTAIADARVKHYGDRAIEAGDNDDQAMMNRHNARSVACAIIAAKIRNPE